MGIFDKFRRKGRDLASQHGDKIDKGIDKGADYMDKRTGGKHSNKIDQAADRAREAAQRYTDDTGRGPRDREPGQG